MKCVTSEQIPLASYEYISSWTAWPSRWRNYSYSFPKQNNRRLKSTVQSALASSLH